MANTLDGGDRKTIGSETARGCVTMSLDQLSQPCTPPDATMYIRAEPNRKRLLPVPRL